MHVVLAGIGGGVELWAVGIDSEMTDPGDLSGAVGVGVVRDPVDAHAHWANSTVAAICCGEREGAELLVALPSDLQVRAAAWKVGLVGVRSPFPLRSKLLLSGSG